MCCQFLYSSKEIDKRKDATKNSSNFSNMYKKIKRNRIYLEFYVMCSNEDKNEWRNYEFFYTSAFWRTTSPGKSNFDIRESDGDSEIIKKVKRGLKILGTDEGSSLPYLLELLQRLEKSDPVKAKAISKEVKIVIQTIEKTRTPKPNHEK